jgi:hypothetical protein
VNRTSFLTPELENEGKKLRQGGYCGIGHKQMKASDLIKALQSLIEEHGDLPVTIVFGNYEYSALLPEYTEEGPLPKVGKSQGQNPPERFVIEPKDDIEDTGADF